MRLLFLYALLIVSCNSYGFIDKIVALASLPARRICRMLGDVHDNDQAGHRTIIKRTVTQRALSNEITNTPKPLTFYVEDPADFPEVEKLFPRLGILPGLVKELREINLPSYMQIINIDPRKYTSCAIKWLNPGAIPSAIKDAPTLKNITFGQAVDELEQGLSISKKQVDAYCQGDRTKWIKTDLARAITQIQNKLEQFKANLNRFHICESDSMLNVGINLFAQEATESQAYQPLIGQNSKSSLVKTLHEGSALPFSKVFYNAASTRAELYMPLYESAATLTSTNSFFNIIDSPGDSCFIAGSSHVDDVSGWMLNTQDWGEHPTDDFFNDNWLVNASTDELESLYSQTR